MAKFSMKWKMCNRLIIALALAHRYLWPLLMILIPLWLGKENWFAFMGTGVLIFAAYTFAGYKLRWKHIYCSYQNAYRQEMTPDHIRWGRIDKKDAYGVPIIFTVLGAACIVCHFLYIYT